MRPPYLRYGTVTLFAALDFKAGTVIGEMHQRRRAVEFRKLLRTIDERVPVRLDLHLIIDSYSTQRELR